MHDVHRRGARIERTGSASHVRSPRPLMSGPTRRAVDDKRSIAVSYSGRFDGVQRRGLDMALQLIGCNRTPNRVDLRVQTLNALPEQIDLVNRPQQQDDDDNQKRGGHSVPSFSFRRSIALYRPIGARV